MTIKRQGWAALAVVVVGVAVLAGVRVRADLARQERERAELVAVAGDPLVAAQAGALNRDASGYHVRAKVP